MTIKESLLESILKQLEKLYENISAGGGGGGGGVSSVTASSPLVSSGGATPNLSFGSQLDGEYIIKYLGGVATLDYPTASLGAFKGAWDASLGTTPTGASLMPGDYYRIVVAGTLTGLSSGNPNVQIGDVIISNVANPTSNSDWFALQTNFSTASDIQIGGVFTPAPGVIVGTDDVKTALQKLQGNISILNSPIFLDETSTIADFQTGNTYYYIGEAPITYDYDLLPYPTPTPVSGFNFVNLSVHDVTINSDGGNATYVLRSTQSLRDIQVVDNGIWAAYATEYYDNIYNIQQVTDKGATTTNAIIIRNNPDNYRTRYSILGQQIQYDLGDRHVDYSYNRIQVNKPSNLTSWTLNYPNIDSNTPLSNTIVNFRPTVSGTVAYLSDIFTTTTYLDPVISQTNTPPVSPTTGDRYLVGTAPTGSWSANAKNIAEWNGLAWVFTSPALDNVVYVADVLTTYRYDGANWVAYLGTAILQNGNSLGASVIIGAKDNQDIRLVQNNIQFARVNTSRQFVLSDNVTAFSPFDTNSSLEISADGPKAKLRVTRFSSNVTAPLFEGYKARGTTAAPLDTVAGDGVFSFLGQARVNGTFQLAGTASLTLGSISGTNQPIGAWNISLASGTGSTATNFALLNRSSATSGTVNLSNLTSFIFDPSTGTAVANLLNLSGTINQTGTASGITRGLNIAPTITAAVDFRALEINTGAGANATHIKLTNSTTGTASTDGTDITLSGLNLNINNKEAGEIRFFTNNVQKGAFDNDGGLTLANVAGDRYALTVTNTVDDNNYTKFTGSSVEYLIGFQTSRFLVKNNTTNADFLSYFHATNNLSLGSATINQNVISLLNSNAGYSSASIGLNNTRKFYYTDGTAVRFWVKPTNVLATDTSAYETLVIADNDFPNKKFVDDNILTSDREQIHAAGATVTVSAGKSILYVNPASTIASLTITLPASPANGQEVKISFGGTLTSGPVATALTISGNIGHTVLGGSGITSADAGDGYIFKFQSSTNTWRIF